MTKSRTRIRFDFISDFGNAAETEKEVERLQKMLRGINGVENVIVTYLGEVTPDVVSTQTS